MEAAAIAYQNGGDGGRVLLVVEVRSNSCGDGARDGSGKSSRAVVAAIYFGRQFHCW